MREFIDWLFTCLTYFLFMPLSYVESAKRQKKESIASKQLGYHVTLNVNPVAYSGITRIRKELEDKANLGD